MTTLRSPLSPLGTARQRLEPTAAPAAPETLEPEAAFLAFEIASWATALAASERRQLETIVANLLAAVEQGSTRVAVDATEAALLARVPELVADRAGRPLVLRNGHLAPERLFAAEARLGAAFAARLAAPPVFSADAVAAALAAVVAGARPRPTAAQEAAARAALTGRLGVITGGPGTGKTTIVLSLVRALGRLGIAPADIALAAPTGKAANRLGEALRAGLAALAEPDAADAALAAAPPAGETLHRLLRHTPSAEATTSGSFAHDENAPLPHRVVIVDESSMIDLHLMDRLVAALAPETLLILLGDADQLPAVEAGTVFRDLARRGVALTESHRLDPSQPESRRILGVAAAIRAGEDALPLLTRRPHARALDFTGVELCPGGDRATFLARHYDERIRPSAAAALAGRVFVSGRDHDAEGGFSPEASALLDRAFAAHGRQRVLTATRAFATGSDAINVFLHARAGARGPLPIAGEPIMMLRNDYDRGLWNGDQGLCIDLVERARQDARSRRVAVFRIEDRWTAFPLGSLQGNLQLGYALTVHKAQGSEYDDVAIVLPEAATPLLSRDLLYTALTRARRSVALCGDEGVLAAGIGNAQLRSSGLAEFLPR